ncbi:hypothetical protein RIF29_41849 [Crotalaria pallida]|uniref:Mannosyl-oligosaccharide glucosidase n=1 Tax=Crotalaria pallida TaxID=3830 RepID=A0AAN9HPS6_CROPI
MNPHVATSEPRSVTPFPAPKLMDLPQFQGEHKESLYWGTYRPQVYLGIRARTPQSLIAGLMWINERDNKYQLRHVCKHEDELSTYGWTKHNGRDFGHQVLADHAMILTTVFLKSKGAGSGYGGDWAVRIDGQMDNTKMSSNDDNNLKTWVSDKLMSVLGYSQPTVIQYVIGLSKRSASPFDLVSQLEGVGSHRRRLRPALSLQRSSPWFRANPLAA